MKSKLPLRARRTRTRVLWRRRRQFAVTIKAAVKAQLAARPVTPLHAPRLLRARPSEKSAPSPHNDERVATSNPQPTNTFSSPPPSTAHHFHNHGQPRPNHRHHHCQPPPPTHRPVCPTVWRPVRAPGAVVVVSPAGAAAEAAPSCGGTAPSDLASRLPSFGQATLSTSESSEHLGEGRRGAACCSASAKGASVVE